MAPRMPRLNGLANIEWREGDAFEVLREFEREGRRFETVVLDPPAFAKTKSALPQAVRGYKEINLRGMRLLAPGGALLTASCSFHLRRPEFLAMLADAAADSGRRLRARAPAGPGRRSPGGPDHPRDRLPQGRGAPGPLIQAAMSRMTSSATWPGRWYSSGRLGPAPGQEEVVEPGIGPEGRSAGGRPASSSRRRPRR